MATIKTLYTGNLRTEATHVASGNTLITDAPTDNNGKGEAFSPTDLTCASLGSCMMTLMGIVAEREGIELKGTQIEITKTMESNPRRISKIQVDFSLVSREELSEAQKGKLQRAALTCSVAMSLHPDIQQEVNFSWSS
jgi:putative redox protein